MNKIKGKGQLILLTAVLIIVVVTTIGFFSYWYFGDKNKNVVKKPSIETQGCGELVTEDGKIKGTIPYSPVVKAKIIGNYQKDAEVCQWTINGNDFGTSKPYGDYCIRYGLTFYNVGEYKISYKVAGLENCPKTITLKIPGMTASKERGVYEVK